MVNLFSINVFLLKISGHEEKKSIISGNIYRYFLHSDIFSAHINENSLFDLRIQISIFGEYSLC
jgi:hypothetical protein